MTNIKEHFRFLFTFAQCKWTLTLKAPQVIKR